MLRRRLLVAFDFDHTMVEENSDIVARKLIHVDLIPEKVRRLYQTSGWTQYMAEVFKLLYKNKVKKEMILGAMHNLTPTPNMQELLKWLKVEGHETIIISDSNSVFIEEWLQHKNLQECVKHVFTNPASFDEKGLLSIQPYQDQNWCDLSTRNLCKGYILETYLKERQTEGESFDAVVYVGDGQNDLCPALKLKENDFVFPRAGFQLENSLKDSTFQGKLAAKVYIWTSADEIRNNLESVL
ncbi:Phospho-2-dehydro-3-deoxyheptonate aldolase AroG [Homalodisca vitripennis]|nr:Phospho-2-dehydro-3-deoxyheptonate aldolase AroG [Homalodisca vitripennis]